MAVNKVVVHHKGAKIKKIPENLCKNGLKGCVILLPVMVLSSAIRGSGEAPLDVAVGWNTSASNNGWGW
jgi:hypothetical protein